MPRSDPPLANFQIGSEPLFLIGTFDTGVTVWSQQVRALNLAHALVEQQFVPCRTPRTHTTEAELNIAIVGGGFAGLTCAAALIKKQVHAKITILEQRDTLLPLQQGSDSRWLHPKIYDWPRDGSETSVAMLPILNWSAARASDVVVQVLTDWKLIAAEHKALKIFCNARHLQVDRVEPSDPRKVNIEWVGELREVDGMASQSSNGAMGCSEPFDVVILAVGFGLEKSSDFSYWRNETLGQPSLDLPRRTFIVAGQGDGAMIDLLRLRISQYRQDRILREMFPDDNELLIAVRRICEAFDQEGGKPDLFAEFERLEDPTHASHQAYVEALADLRRRLRRDTDVILRLKVRRFSELYTSGVRISFQNKLLAFLLYKCGGFSPSSVPVEELREQHGISDNQIIKRFGPSARMQLGTLLSEGIIKSIFGEPEKKPVEFEQPDTIVWPGGYFGYPGLAKNRKKLSDDLKEHWRREYLPGATALLGASLSAAIAGRLKSSHSINGRLRVTVHRTMHVGNEELLQQTCDYAGTKNARGRVSTAARALENNVATIGLAYACRKIIRSVPNVDKSALKRSMIEMRLLYSSRSMSKEVSFVLAIPLLEPEDNYTLNSPVAGVIYIDSTDPDFYVDDDELRHIASMAQSFLDDMERHEPLDRIQNQSVRGTSNKVLSAASLTSEQAKTLQIVDVIACPRTSRPFQMNFDYLDFALTHSDAK